MPTLPRKAIKFLSSLRLTVTLLGLAMVLIFVATVTQVELGIHEVQLRFFRSWIAWWDLTHIIEELTQIRGLSWLKLFSGITLPLPGGTLLGTLLIINLLVAHGARFKLRWNKAGMLLIHFGIMIMLLGELFTALLGKEAQMPIDEGQTKNYSVFQREVELVIIEPDGSGTETITAIPQSRLRDGAAFPMDGFSVKIHSFFRNSEILPESAGTPEFEKTRATLGVGKPFVVRGTPRETQTDRRDLSTAFVEIIPENGKLIGRWLLSNALKSEEGFEIAGKPYRMTIRQRRLYHSFSIKLLDFSHDRYLGTNVPKNFSSKIRIMNPETGEDREDLIYMNHPLRYGGLTFYQSGFDNNDSTSILQVVSNPVWTLPYISCAMVGLGLLWVFSQHLIKAVSRRNKTAKP